MDSLAEAREERQTEINEAVEDATYPYRRALEEIHANVKSYRDRQCVLSEARNAADIGMCSINEAIDKYELREELDI